MELLTEAEVAKHAGAESCWVVIHGQVYDVTEFAKEHPGGKQILLANGGADVTALFDQLHAPSVLESVTAKFRLGALGEVAQPLAPAAPAGPPAAATPATAGEPEELLNWRISSRATPSPHPSSPRLLSSSCTAPCAAFPHDQFNDSGLEAARFKWSQAEEFTRHDADTEDFKLRSYLRPLVRLPAAGPRAPRASPLPFPGRTHGLEAENFVVPLKFGSRQANALKAWAPR